MFLDTVLCRSFDSPRNISISDWPMREEYDTSLEWWCNRSHFSLVRSQIRMNVQLSSDPQSTVQISGYATSWQTASKSVYIVTLHQGDSVHTFWSTTALYSWLIAVCPSAQARLLNQHSVWLLVIPHTCNFLCPVATNPHWNARTTSTVTTVMV